MVGWVGDPDSSQMNPVLFADADFAGCLASSKSTSGSFLALDVLVCFNKASFDEQVMGA